MTGWMNIILAIQTADKHCDITPSGFPGHAAATLRAKASIYSHRVEEVNRLTFCPFEGFCRKINTRGECCAGLSPAQRAMAVSNTYRIFAGTETDITA